MEEVLVPGDKPVRLLEWKVNVDDSIKHGALLAIYRHIEDPASGIKTKEMQLKSKHVGKVKRLMLQIGQVAKPGCPLLQLEGCSHPIVMKDMCAECGQDLRLFAERHGRKSAHVSMIHNIPELKISAQQAEVLAKQDEDRLHKLQKLVLLVDLDQTLIHTTQNPLFANLCNPDENFYTFHLQKNDPTLYTKLRPHCRDFIEKISKLFELQIVTFGSRQYAHKIADFIDPKRKYFANRILSRDECIDPMKKSVNLRHLFPCGDSMVCIIDDRDDVWNAAPNLVLVKKYSYFPGAGDINSPDKLEALNNKNDKTAKHNEKVSAVEPQSGDSSLESKVSPRKRKSDEIDVESDATASKLPKTTTYNEEKEGDQEKSVSVATQPVEKQAVDHLTNTDSLQSGIKTDGPQNIENSNCTQGEIVQHKTIENDEDDNELSQQKNDEPSLLDFIPPTPNEATMDCNDSKISVETSDPDISSLLDSNHNEKNCVPDENISKVEEMDEGDNCNIAKCKPVNQNGNKANVCRAPKGAALEDKDDYLLFLQEVLTQIHKTYYEAYEKYQSKEFEHPPDLRGVVPYLRSKVLFGCHLVFTGVIPNNYKGPPSQHRAHVVAKQLGAVVESKVTEKTTHLVGGKKGTAKYQECVKMGKDKVKLVSADWLWACSERFERVAEQLFPIPKNNSTKVSSREGTPPVTQAKASADSKPTAAPTYNAITGKLVKRVKDARFNFVLSEAIDRNARRKKATPLYSSLIDPEVVVPLVAELPAEATQLQQEDAETPSTSKGAVRTRKPSMAEVMGIGYSLSSNDIEDMDKEVDDLMNDEDGEDSLGTMIDRPSSSSSSESSQKLSEPGTCLTPKLTPVAGGEDASDKSSSSSEEEFDHMAELLDHEMHYDEDNADDENDGSSALDGLD